MTLKQFFRKLDYAAIALGALIYTNVAAAQNLTLSAPPQPSTALNGHRLPVGGQTVPLNSSTAASAQQQTHHISRYQAELKSKVDALRLRSAGAHGTNAKEQATQSNAAAPLSSNFPGFAQTPSFVAADPENTLNSPFVGLTMDVNRDGKPDLVTFNYNGELNVSLNPGTADFSKWVITSTNSSGAGTSGARGVTAAQAIDVNQDGYLDIVAVDTVTSSALVFVNRQDGTFANPSVVPTRFSSSAVMTSIVSADYNNDGIPDLAAVGFYTDEYNTAEISVLVCLGKGDGTFLAPLPEQDKNYTGLTDLQNRSQNVLTADMNKDGKMDLVFPIAAFDKTYRAALVVTVLTGNGNGTFSNLPNSFPPADKNPPIFENYYTYESDAVADINHDGNLDVIFSTGGEGLWVSYGNGDGTMMSPQLVTQVPGTGASGQVLVGYADVTGDGNLDIIGYNTGNISVYPGQSGGTFSSTPLMTVVAGIAQAQQPTPADFNGDGVIDLVSLDQISYRIGFYPGSNGTFSGTPALAGGDNVADDHQVVASGDFNGDGVPDIILADYALNSSTTSPPSLKYGKNDGKGNFTYATAISEDVMTTANVIDVFPVNGDFNGDGKIDLVVELNSGIGIASGNGDGTFAAPQAIPSPAGQNFPCGINQVDVGDLNGDGLPDIVGAYNGNASCEQSSSPSGIVIYLNQGSNNFSASYVPYGFAISLVKLGDLNSDGKLDVLASDATSAVAVEGYGATAYYNLYVIPGNGDGTLNLAASNFVMENTFVGSLGIADLNNDGKADIVAGVVTQVDEDNNLVYGTTATYILPGNGDFTFQLPLQYDPGLYAVGQTFADLNGDGRPDIVLAEAQFGAVYVPAGSFNTLVNLGGMAFAPDPRPVFTGGASDSANIFTADYNTDKSVDVMSGNYILYGYVTQYFLNQGGVAMTLTASSNSVLQDTPVAITASVSATVSSASPSGTVTFYDGSTLLGSDAVTNGTATLPLSSLPVGSDVVTASYSGDANLNAANASTTVTVASLAPAFVLGASSPGTLSLQAGETGVITMMLSGNATFAGSVALSCTGAPAESACTVSPSTVTVNGTQATSVSVVISTTPKNNAYSASLSRAIGGVSLSGLLLLVLPRRRRLPRILSVTLLCILAGTGAFSLTGCGGGGTTSSNQYPGTPMGTSTLTVTATSGSITQTQQFTLTVSNN